MNFNHSSTLNTAAVNHSKMPTRLRPQPSYASLVLLLLILSSAGDASPSAAIARFRDYLRINTAHPSPDYSAAVRHLLTFAATIPGLHHQILQLTEGKDKPLLLLTLSGSNPSLPAVLFNSHLDSVPAEPSKWSSPPFEARRTQDGRIYARGAQDDKCIGMQYLEAIKKLKDSNFEFKRTVYITYVPDEEVGGFDGMAKFVESDVFREMKIGFVLDEGQASIGDEYRVFYADRSPWHVVVKARGSPGHGSRMFDGSAMENLMVGLERVMRFRDSQFDKVKAGLMQNSEVVSVNTVFLKGGIAANDGFVMNMQPSEVEAGFDVRLPPTADPDDVRRRIAEEWAPSWRNMSYEITEKGPLRDYMGRPLMTMANGSNPWWSVFERAVESAGGKLNKPEILPSTTDARFMRQKGIPALGFSPMKNTPILLHDHNEYLEESVYLEGIKVYEHIIKALSSFEGC